METKIESKKSEKTKKVNYKPLLAEISKAAAYSFLTGICMAAGGHAYASMMRPKSGKLISINGGKQSQAV